MLNRAISTSKRMADLADDTSRMLFAWMIPHFDAEGRMKGDPALFRSIVCPRLTHITIEKVEECLRHWAKKRLILWYEIGDEKFIYCMNWNRQQRGLRKEREAVSRNPAPPPELLRSNSGAAPPAATQNGMEWNGKETNRIGEIVEKEDNDEIDPFEQIKLKIKR